MEHPSNDQQHHPNQQENSHRVCDETGHPVLSLTKSKWKLRQPIIRITQWRENHCGINTSIRRMKEI